MAKQTFKTPLNFQQVSAGSLEDKVLVRSSEGDLKEISSDSFGISTFIPKESIAIEEIGAFITAITAISDLSISAPNTTYSYTNSILTVAKSTGNYFADEFVFASYGSSVFENFDLEIIAVCRVAGLGLAPFLRSSQLLYKFNWSCRNTNTGMAISSTLGDGSTWSDRATSTDSLNIGVNDQVSFKMSRLKNKITYTVTNLSTSESKTMSFVSNYNEVDNCQPTMFRYGFQVLGGEWDITNFTAKTKNLRNIDNLFVGDSITQGFSMSASGNVLTSSSSRFYDLVNSAFANKKNANHSAGGAQIIDMQGTFNEIKNINPKNVFIMLGTNGQNTTDYSAFVTMLLNSGFNVVPMTIPPPNGAFNNFIKSQWPKSLDVSAPLFTGSNSNNTTWNSTYEGYGGHPNSAGHYQIYLILKTYLLTSVLSKPKISLSQGTNTQLTLNWTQITNNSGYKLQVSTNGYSFTDLANTSANSNSYTHTALKTGATYYYRVQAIGNSVRYNSGYSDIAYYLVEPSVLLGDYSSTSANANKILTLNKKLPSGVDGWVKFSTGLLPIGKLDRVVLAFRHDNLTTGIDNFIYHNYIFYYQSDSYVHTSSLNADVATPVVPCQKNQWLRLRRKLGVVYYEYSNDNLSWFILGARADTTDLYVQIMFLISGTQIEKVTVSDGFVNV
ncbi:MAG: hypothetical protein REI96_06380 [Flavobacterium nitrogenifigens]|uniref:hypothetical protein n=1 Tax=Flavobacterium nitrogenifigens TaxID=1617283 RepID=UPI0028085521|nr:hypothetical protein [Flavobacterium nitrogenifigens]MDQ8012054.1 hypothetical protein [Flavobacterium nitrogenifigens]